MDEEDLEGIVKNYIYEEWRRVPFNPAHEYWVNAWNDIFENSCKKYGKEIVSVCIGRDRYLKKLHEDLGN